MSFARTRFTPLALCLIATAGLTLARADAAAAAIEGDVSHAYQCTAAWNVEGFEIKVAIEIWYLGGLHQYATSQGWNSVTLQVTGEAPARPQDYTAYCRGALLVRVWSCVVDECWAEWQQWDQWELPLDIEGSGPPSIHIVTDAFLAYEYISVPFDLFLYGYDVVDQGDDRSFTYDEYGSASRISSRFTLSNTAVYADTFINYPEPATGLSQVYHAESSLTAFPYPGWNQHAPHGGSLKWEAREDWTRGDDDLKIDYAVGTGNDIACDAGQRDLDPGDPKVSRVRIRCWGYGYEPFIGNAPPIRWDLTLDISFGHNKAVVAVTGCHGKFPAHQVYANGVAIVTATDSGSPLDLFDGCAVQVNRTEEIR